MFVIEQIDNNAGGVDNNEMMDWMLLQMEIEFIAFVIVIYETQLISHTQQLLLGFYDE